MMKLAAVKNLRELNLPMAGSPIKSRELAVAKLSGSLSLHASPRRASSLWRVDSAISDARLPG
jgi:hypothetical protein